MKNKSVIEYSVVGIDIEEHFDTYKEAYDFCNELTLKDQRKVQLFSKEWEEGQEGEVKIFKNHNEIL